MQAITIRDHDAGVGGLSLPDVPYPHAAQNDIIVGVRAAGPSADRQRRPTASWNGPTREGKSTRGSSSDRPRWVTSCCVAVSTRRGSRWRAINP
jgi:hypothetical protein